MVCTFKKKGDKAACNSLKLYIQVLKVQYWLEEAQGLPLRSCLYLTLKRKKAQFVSPSPLKYIRQ